MSPNRVPPPFPQPFASTGAPEHRSMGHAQGSTYPPEGTFPFHFSRHSRLTPSFLVHRTRGAPHVEPPPPVPPRPPHPPAHSPAYQPMQPIQGVVRPAFPTPQVQYPRAPTATLDAPPQRGETTHMPRHLHNNQVAPGFHSGPPSQL